MDEPLNLSYDWTILNPEAQKMKPILLLDESLQVEVFFESDDCGYEDNICLKITESCPEEEKVFLHDESHLYLTPMQAQELSKALDQAVKLSSFTKK
jgi:hypothetical protein